MPPEQDLPLESLEKRIYEASPQTPLDVPAYTSEHQANPYGWQAPPPPPPLKKRMPWTVKFLIVAGVFLLIAGAAAAYILIWNTRSVSNNNVQISAPVSAGIASGDTVSIVVTIHNGNPAALTDASFNATLPNGTRTRDGTDAPLAQYNDVLGPIRAGADITRTIQVKLFGEAGQVLTIPMKVQYHVAGSNALFQTEKDYTVTISSSPITVQVQSISQTPSGQSFSMTVVVRSNSSTAVDNVALTAAYPSGFSVQSTVPAASGTNYFNLGTIKPGEQKTLQVRGVLIGQSSDQRVFRFDAGSANPDGTSTLGNTFAEGSATVAITHPFLNVALSLNSETTEPTLVSPGTSVNALMGWQNTLPNSLANASIKISVSGNALAPGSISGGTGFYRSADQSVLFDSTTNSGLASLGAGQSGVGSFSFAIKPAVALANVQNPMVTLTVSVMGIQGDQGGTAQTLTSTLVRTVKVGTFVTISSSLSHTNGGANGPVPPKVGTETLYTVTLNAKNTVNSIGASKETFTLPSYVRYTGTADAGVTYNPDSHTVTWSIGDMASGGSATAHLQVGITPSSSQAGASPLLVNEQSFTGFDRFTQLQVTAKAPALSTELPGNAHSGTVH